MSSMAALGLPHIGWCALALSCGVGLETWHMDIPFLGVAPCKLLMCRWQVGHEMAAETGMMVAVTCSQSDSLRKGAFLHSCAREVVKAQVSYLPRWGQQNHSWSGHSGKA